MLFLKTILEKKVLDNRSMIQRHFPKEAIWDQVHQRINVLSVVRDNA